ncbi:hypothetical protein GCM10020220_081800 [Nonomuraea rubra]
MMTNCERHESLKIGRVQPATAAARKFAPTGPQVQKPKAWARPRRGEKSRISGAVLAMATPSTNASTILAISRSLGLCTRVMAKQHTAVSAMSGMSSRTRPSRSVSRPPRMEAIAPATAAAPDTAPYMVSVMSRSLSSRGTTGAICPS